MIKEITLTSCGCCKASFHTYLHRWTYLINTYSAFPWYCLEEYRILIVNLHPNLVSSDIPGERTSEWGTETTVLKSQPWMLEKSQQDKWKFCPHPIANLLEAIPFSWPQSFTSSPITNKRDCIFPCTVTLDKHLPGVTWTEGILSRAKGFLIEWIWWQALQNKRYEIKRKRTVSFHRVSPSIQFSYNSTQYKGCFARGLTIITS